MHDLIDKKTGKYPTKSDMEVLKKVLEMYQFTDPQKIFFLNNTTQMKASKTIVNIRAMCRENPEENYVIISLYACHGMVRDGRQVVVLNQFEKC